MLSSAKRISSLSNVLLAGVIRSTVLPLTSGRGLRVSSRVRDRCHTQAFCERSVDGCLEHMSSIQVVFTCGGLSAQITSEIDSIIMVHMSCLVIIRSARDEMSANEKKLADFILNNASLIRDYSSQQIAGSVGVSQSSVVKFGQKLGYKGFTDLKLAIHESVVKQESNVAVLRGESASKGARFSLKDKMYQTKCDAISGATNLNDEDTILAAARAIQTSSRVQLVGSGSACAVAQDTAFKLMGFGKPVIVEDDPDLQLLGVGTLGRGDCLIIISPMGQSSHQSRLAKQAKQAGVTVISVTNQAANPVAALADIRLYSLPPGGDADMLEVIAVTSQQHVMDLVFYTLALRVSRNRELRGGSSKAADATKAK